MSAAIIVASSSGSAAAAAASRARDAECRIVLKTYDPATTTQKEQVNYAQCVMRFNPPSEGEIAAGKIIVAGVLLFVVLGAIGGAIWAKFSDYINDTTGITLSAVMGAIIGLVSAFCLFLVIAAVGFLLS